MEYLGEIVSKKQGDMRGTYYDDNGLSYLYDLNDLTEEDEREQLIQKLFHSEFFPLCIDAMFYGNEARFINHSCDPNVMSFNLSGQLESNAYHSVGLFAQRKIMPGEELTLDYSWDKNILQISEDVPCLCGSENCRGFLMRAKKNKKQQNAAKFESQVSSKLEDESAATIKNSKIAASESLPPARVVKRVASSPLSAETLLNRKPANVTLEVANKASCSPASSSEDQMIKLMENDEEEDDLDRANEEEDDCEDMPQEEEDLEEEEDEAEDEVDDKPQEEMEDEAQDEVEDIQEV